MKVVRVVVNVPRGSTGEIEIVTPAVKFTSNHDDEFCETWYYHTITVVLPSSGVFFKFFLLMNNAICETYLIVGTVTAC